MDLHAVAADIVNVEISGKRYRLHMKGDGTIHIFWWHPDEKTWQYVGFGKGDLPDILTKNIALK